MTTNANDAAAKGRPVAFLFSGQGSQYLGMGRGLYQSLEAFRQAVDECCVALEPHLGLDLRQVLYPAAGEEEAAGEQLGQTRLTQPALFVVEYAAARLWRSWGVEPAAMLGHSIGEYVAATLAGVFRLEDALRLVARRGALMQGLPAGSMLSVPMEESLLLPRLGEGLSLAAINAAGRCVVSGETPAIDEFAAVLKAERVPASKLHTSHAFHSHMMDPILPEFVAEVGRAPRAAPSLPYVSNLTGDWMDLERAQDPEYWAAHLRGAVRFSGGVAKIFELAEDAVLLEVGPGNTLVTLSQRHPARREGHVLLTTIRHPKEKEADDLAFLAATVAKLREAGIAVAADI
jgi:phthiocerol/phenolphthiocerol synthesis type-I polyketide synthase E